MNAYIQDGKLSDVFTFLPFFNRVSDKISEKRDITTSKGRAWVRTKLSFCLLRSTHLCWRGSCSRRQLMYESVADTDIKVGGLPDGIKFYISIKFSF